jgi:hypothetical protein
MINLDPTESYNAPLASWMSSFSPSSSDSSNLMLTVGVVFATTLLGIILYLRNNQPRPLPPVQRQEAVREINRVNIVEQIAQCINSKNRFKEHAHFMAGDISRNLEGSTIGNYSALVRHIKSYERVLIGGRSDPQALDFLSYRSDWALFCKHKDAIMPMLNVVKQKHEMEKKVAELREILRLGNY